MLTHIHKASVDSPGVNPSRTFKVVRIHEDQRLALAVESAPTDKELLQPLHLLPLPALRNLDLMSRIKTSDI
jgi:hypothetical protein